MIDFHSHILPCIDDGSGSVEESIQMLRRLTEQGIDTVCATPHFYPSENSPNDFLETREKSYQMLVEQLAEEAGLPKIVLGAEVAYYSGISRMQQLCDMLLQGTEVLLLEMPIVKWSEYMIREILDISCARDITVVLAHIERYIKFQSKDVWDKLFESGVLMQVNATFFANQKTRRRALKMLKKGEIHLIGSDTHNLSYRAPQIDSAVEIIKSKLGAGVLDAIDSLGRKLISKKE